MARLRRIILGITGASGAIYGLRLLEELLRARDVETHLVISPAGAQVMEIENGLKVDLARFRPGALGLRPTRRLIYHSDADLAAPLSSGSFRVRGMVIAPCSMGCAGRLANGSPSDLIERAADVTIKEGRRLVLAPRETPLSAIHLENLLKLARLGVTVLPACPGFYGKAARVGDLVDFVVARVLDHLHIPHRLGRRWKDGD
jgi:4-hydroxy-3-polyprenylbenzoate decarboxylase